MIHKISVLMAVGALSALAAGSAAAQTPPTRMAQIANTEVLPPGEIANAVRSIGLRPLTRPLRQGHYYVLQALDTRGFEYRVVADGHFGDVISISPAQSASYYTPRNYGGPRIVDVPPDDRRWYDDEGPAPRPPGRVMREYSNMPPDYEPMPRPEERQVTAPPQHEDRRITTAPAPQAAPRTAAIPPAARPQSDGPSPIRPLPTPGESRKAGTPLPQPKPKAGEHAQAKAEEAHVSAPASKTVRSEHAAEKPEIAKTPEPAVKNPADAPPVQSYE